MDAVAVALVLTAAAFHAGWNLLLHDTEDRLAAMAVAGLAAFVLLLPATVVVGPWRVWWLVPLSGLTEAAYGAFLAASYAHGRLSFSYPVGRGTAPLLVLLGGWLVLSEQPRLHAILGAMALGVGLTLLALGAARGGSGLGVLFAVLTGLTIATYSLSDAYAVRRVQPLGYLGPVLGIEGLVLFGAVSLDRDRLRRAAGAGVRIAAGSIGAYLLVLLAFRRAGAGPVATLREISVLLGMWLSRERAGALAWVGAVLCVGGAVLAVL
jgi:drug/metabolite transporter (DMT)-like permease